MNTPADRIPIEEFVAWLRAQPEDTMIVQGREAQAPNEIEHNDAIRRAAAAVAAGESPRDQEKRGNDSQGRHLFLIERLDEPGHEVEQHWLIRNSDLKKVALWWAEHSDDQAPSRLIASGRERPRIRITNRATQVTGLFDVASPTTPLYFAREVSK